MHNEHESRPRRMHPAPTLHAITCLLAVAALAAAGSAQADYATGFEAPDFTTGTLDGQAGWHEYPGPTAVDIDNALARTGTQALTIIPALAAGQDGAYYTDNTPDPVVVQSADIYLYSSSAQSEWQFAALGANLIGFAGGIDILPDDSVILTSAGFPTVATFTRNQWNHVALTLDYSSQTFSVDLNGARIASNVAFCGDNGPCTSGANVPFHANGFFDAFGGPGVNDLGVLDNYSVTTVPEANSWAMLAAGLGLVGWQTRRTRWGKTRP